MTGLVNGEGRGEGGRQTERTAISFIEEDFAAFADDDYIPRVYGPRSAHQ
jgi:hypothetical protein